jgi:putative transposase
MATFRRAFSPGGSFFFTVATHQRQPLLTHPEVVTALRHAFRTVKADHPFVVDAIVILPDHLHTVWTLPPGDSDYPRRWNLIKRTTSIAARHLVIAPLRASLRQRHEIGLWQRRYWEHQIRDERDFARHVDYIHWNPVKHGHVERVADWPYSSFHRYARNGSLPADWATTDPDGQSGETPNPP